MAAVIPGPRKMLLTVFLAAACLLAIAAWVESSSTALLGRNAVEHGRRIAADEKSRVLEVFEREVEVVSSSLRRTTIYAASILSVLFAGIVALWIPRREEESSQAPSSSSLSGISTTDATGRASNPRALP
jgi:hypothetical protein